MSSGPRTQSTPPPTRMPLRLRLKPKAPATGYVDGAWWPRSQDLITELPTLVEVLAVRLGRIERVTFGLSTWDVTPRRLLVDGFGVHLEGFHYQDQNIVHVTGSNRGRVSLMVVPPATEEQIAHDALLTAGRRDNADRPEEILAAAGIPAQRATGEDAKHRWEGDGGHVLPR